MPETQQPQPQPADTAVPPGLAGLPLLVETAPTWAGIALANLDAVLIDHAFCEHKAAVAALGLIGRYPDVPGLVRPMLALSREEMMHMRQVLDILDERGVTLGSHRPDPYVRELRRRFSSEGEGLGGLGDQLLVNAFVEARSCERFRILGQALEQPSADETADLTPSRERLARFYVQLAEAEWRHWELFRDLAIEALPRRRVERRLAEVAEIEADVVRTLPVLPRMH